MNVDLALVPGVEQLLVRQAADQAGMDQAGKAHARHVARMGVEAGNVPDRLLRQRKVIGEKAAAVLLGEEAVEAPQALRQRADVEEVDDQEIAGLGALDADRAGQEVHDGEIDIAHVVRRLVVLDEAAGPVVGLDDEIVAGLHPRDDRNVGVPAVVDHVVLVGRFREVDLDQRLRLAGSRVLSIVWCMVSLRLGRKAVQTARKRAIAASSTCSRVSVCTIRPSSITRMRSAMSRTKLSTCSQTTMQRLRSSGCRAAAARSP